MYISFKFYPPTHSYIIAKVKHILYSSKIDSATNRFVTELHFFRAMGAMMHSTTVLGFFASIQSEAEDIGSVALGSTSSFVIDTSSIKRFQNQLLIGDFLYIHYPYSLLIQYHCDM